MALKWLRDQFKHLKIILWAVVGVFLALVFVDWGSGRGGSSSAEESAIRIGDRVVNEQEFVSQLRQNQQRYQQLYGDQWSLIKDQIDLASQTVQTIIEREILLEEAEHVGIVVSPDELRDEILSYPAFQREGGGFVGQETYSRILRANRTTAHEFEQGLSQDLKLRKLNSMMQEGVFVSDTEIEESYRHERELSDFESIQLRYERFLTEVEVSDDEAKAYFDSHADSYQRPEQRTIRYVVVETSKLRRILDADEESLKSFYGEHQQEFMVGEEAKAANILIRLNPDAGDVEKADAKLHADQVAALAKSGAPFAELAAKHSDDPDTRDNGGDLGWIGRGRAPEFEEAIFGAKPGDIVGPIESRHGYNVLKVEAYRPERVRPFEEVREQVKFRFLEGKAAAESESRAIALARRLNSEKPETDELWQVIADEDEVVVLNVSPAFGNEEMIPGTGNDPDFVKEVFDAKFRHIGGPRAIPRGWIVWQLKEVQPEGIPAYEVVKAEVEQEIRREKALVIATERGQELAEQWRVEGVETQTLAEKFDGTIVPARDHRRGTAIGTVGVLPAVDEAVFSAKDGDIVGPVSIGDRGVFVVKVEKLTLIDPEQFATEKDTIRTRLMRERATRLMSSMINERRRDTVVTVNNELMERFAPQGS